jgi:hypothetical protein
VKDLVCNGIKIAFRFEKGFFMDIYQKNIAALQKVNSTLVEKISKIDTNTRYEVFQGDTYEAINILDTKTQEFLYVNPLEDTLKLQLFFQKYKEYEYLFFYGIGNGVLINQLSKNEKLNKLIVIEPEYELLYIAFNLVDFSNVIETTKIIFLDIKDINFSFLTSFLNQGKLRYYAKLYTLHTCSSYYEKVFFKEYKLINSTFIQAYEHRTYTDGNDITDQFLGLKYTMKNLPIMLQNPTFNELRKQKNSNLAVVVSTGPSLHKQLDLLKQYQDYITIISVDASLPILEKHGIKPDIVTSIERIELTSSFFKKTSKKFQKDIIFAFASLTHPTSLEASHGTKVLIQRPFAYNRFLGFDEYGYIGHGMSAANLAHELAITMGYKNCVLIGQDLAYGQDGMSHSVGHILGEDSDVDRFKATWIQLDAYGGKGKVKSTQIWKLFKNFFEQIIIMTSPNVNTYNCTEGGARIEGSIEQPFKYVLEKNVNTNIKKAPIQLSVAEKTVYQKKLEKAQNIFSSILSSSTELEKDLKKVFLSIEKFTKKYNDKDIGKIIEKTKDKDIIKKLDEISNIREKLESDEVFKNFIYDIAKPYLLHYELDLAVIKVQVPNTTIENKAKAIKWIFNHRYWLFSLLGIIHNIKETIENELKEWD